MPKHVHEFERLDYGSAHCYCGASAQEQGADIANFPYRRVVVTGGAGFLGRAVVRRLRTYDGIQVIAPRKIHYDLTQFDKCEQLLSDTQPDLIIHLAATVGGIGFNKQNPARLFYDNAIMGIQLMEQARLAGVKKFVAVGTVCAYPKHTPTPFSEGDLWNGYPEETNAPYGIAKKLMLVQSQAYREQYGFNSIFLLPANLYGPHDNFDLDSSHVIPALIRKSIEARESDAPYIEAWGSGEVSREFLYVDDCADGIIRAAILYNESEPINLGTGCEIRIEDLAHTISRLTNFQGEIRWNGKLDGQPRRQLDTSRAWAKFGFKAKTRLEDGLRETVRWYEENRDVQRAGPLRTPVQPDVSNSGHDRDSKEEWV